MTLLPVDYNFAGPTTDAFVAVIYNYAKTHKGLRVAELGVYDGATTCAAIQVVKLFNGEYVAVDWFKGTIHPGWETSKHLHSYRPEQDVSDVFISNVKQTYCDDILTTLKMKTEEAVNHIEDKSLDICFIDASHAYIDVKKDIEMYLPKIKDGGIICGHDCDDITRAGTFKPADLLVDTIDNGQIHAGVIQAVYDKFGDCVEILSSVSQSPNIWVKQL